MQMQKTNEPGIYQLEDGRWRVRVTAQCSTTGKMKEAQRTLKKGRSLEDAITLRDELRERLRETETQPQIVSQQFATLADYCDWWIQRKARKAKKSTMVKTAQVLGRFVLPQLGHIRLDRLTRKDISDWLIWSEQQTDRKGRLYSDAYVKSWWRVFKPLLRDAYAQGHIPEDITQRHEAPSTGVHGRQEKKTLSRQELDHYLDVFREAYPDRYPEVLLLAHTGMRPGELYGLEWRDIDLEERCVHIQRSVFRGVVSTTKTVSPRRAPLTLDVLEVLKRHRQRQLSEQAPGLSEGIVFPADNGNRRYPSSIRKPMGIVAKHIDAAQRVTPQVLRRTLITLLVEAGVDRIVIWSIVGHSSEQMTQRYTGVRLDQQTAAADRVFDARQPGTSAAADAVDEVLG